MKHAILEGLVYNKTTPQGIVYAVSISYPQTDLYAPLSLTVSADGKISMAKEEVLEDLYETEEERWVMSYELFGGGWVIAGFSRFFPDLWEFFVGMKILIVEDEQDLWETIRTSLLKRNLS